ncbi:hypothetical protein Tco_1194285 [Tanacetum coccineum]
MLIFYPIIDFLTGGFIITRCWLITDLIGPWLHSFGLPLSQSDQCYINIRRQGSGKKILIYEAHTSRADLLFDDEIGEVQLFLLIMYGLARTYSNGTLSYVIQWSGVRSIVFEQAVEGHSPKFSCWISPLTLSMLELVTAWESGGRTYVHSSSFHRAEVMEGCSRYSKSKYAAHLSTYASVQVSASFHGTANSRDCLIIQGTADFPSTAELTMLASISNLPMIILPQMRLFSKIGGG